MLRENRRIKTALVMARLSTIKTLAGFDFSFQPSLDKNRIMALAELEFIDRNEVVHLLGPPGTGKSHLSLALGVRGCQSRTQRLLQPAHRSRRAPSPRPNARALCARRSDSSAASHYSSSMRSATCRSSQAAAICSSSSSTPATNAAQ